MCDKSDPIRGPNSGVTNRCLNQSRGSPRKTHLGPRYKTTYKKEERKTGLHTIESR